MPRKQKNRRNSRVTPYAKSSTHRTEGQSDDSVTVHGDTSAGAIGQDLVAAAIGIKPSREIGLIHLDDYALCDILEKLSLDELYATAITCKRLNVVARGVFRLNHGKKIIEFGPKDLRRYGRKVDLYMIRFLSTFGDLISHIKITSYTMCHGQFNKTDLRKLDNILFNLIVKYCAGSLTTLQINNWSFRNLRNRQKINPLPLLQTIKELTFEYCWLPKYMQKTLAECKELERLTVAESKYDCFGNFYPRIKSIGWRFQGTLTDSIDAEFQSFLQMNPALIEINISDPYFNFESCASLDILKNLQKLTLSTSVLMHNHIAERFLHASYTESLQYLDIRFSNQWWSARSTNLWRYILRFENLKVLKLDYFATVSDTLFVLPNLTELIVRGSFDFSNEDLIEFIGKMPKLQHLGRIRYDQNAKFNKSTYMKLCEICGKRNQVLKLFNSEGDVNQMERIEFEGNDENVFKNFVQCFNDKGNDHSFGIN